MRPPSALDLPALDPLPIETQKYFDVCQEKLGLVPNVLRAYAFDTDKLNAFTAMYNDMMLGASGLSKLEREMIAVLVSAINKCHYCLVAHGAALRQLSGDPGWSDLIMINWRVADLSPRHMAMLTFAEALTQAPDRASEADRQALRDAGFSDRDIFDIVSVSAFFNMSNRVASGIAMRPNPEYQNMGR